MFEWIKGFEDKNPTYISKEISKKDFSIELAYHEASHLVFQRLIHKLDLDFNEPISMFIDSENKEKAGCVHGFGLSGMNPNTPLTPKAQNQIITFFTDKKERLFSDCLQHLAGYTSYKIFIDSATEYYISNSDINTSKYQMYKLDTVLDNQYGVDDFFKVKKRLQYIGVSDKQKLQSFYHKITDDVLEIMDIRAVELSIRYVKNHLLRNDGKLIEGECFQEIKEFVDELIKNVSIKPFISKYLD